jgi:DNA polymerase III sliding clamp (beta) subunit (PCNA family)
MKLEINTALMQAVCNKLVKAVSTKDIIPSLKNFLFDIAEKNIHIIAGDSATYLEKDIPCNSITEIGRVSVDGKEFTKLINKINSETIIIETTTDNKLKIVAGKSKFHLKTINADDYVYPDNLVPDVVGIKLSLPQVKRSFKLGSITVSKNATEIYFTGYKLGKTLMTTNRNNLTIFEMNVCEDSLLLTQDLVDLINDMDGETAELSYTSDFLEIKTEGTRILGNLLCGLENFPDDDILSNFNYDKMAVVSKKSLLPVLDRALIFVDTLGAIELVFKENIIECRLVGGSDVDTYEEIPYQGNVDVSIKVNVGMLYQIASALDTETLELHVDSSDNPLLIKAGPYQSLMASMAVE